ncbi:uncharacterized protein LOC106058616 [Biomphalaria glabrata]|uniref:Uncharacterized protein LOC106058616 n=1 Tax=Biomphalaria glabrata TaxID=6526 RepID=A0A9W2ZF74_BIOGL|nr:uncharacterized protein LOC106058616 [Biomphalaria glabrata]KAI8751937.1 polcalcin Bra n 2-like [Biomphalaria glabrata]
MVKTDLNNKRKKKDNPFYLSASALPYLLVFQDICLDHSKVIHILPLIDVRSPSLTLNIIIRPLYHLAQMSVLFYSAVLLCLPALSWAQIFTLRPYNNTANMAFRLSDYNGDNILDKNELERFFQDFDANGDGRVSFQEYSNYVHNNQHDPEINAFFHALYDVYDVNNDRHVDHDDFLLLYALMDFNDDNVISRQEFVHYFSIIFETIDHNLNGA